MSDKPCNLIWFRNDLRLHDNPALSAACTDGAPVVALFILDEESSGARALGGASRWWLHHSLEALAGDLEKIGVELILRRGISADVLDEIIEQAAVQKVFWNRRYDPAGIACDKAIKSSLSERDIDVESFAGSVLTEPFNVFTEQNTAYRVFTPYWRAAKSTIGNVDVLAMPDKQKKMPAESPAGENLGDWSLLPRKPDWAGGLRDTWTPGEAGARSRLEAFLDDGLEGYSKGRDHPSQRRTSNLSPHLRFGEISPRTLWRAVMHRADSRETLREDAEKFLSELGWRDFSTYLLFHHPKIVEENFNSRFDDFGWREDEKQLAAWQKGQTGYPIVDAGMRELWETGTMHNRVRMIAASFLTKHLRLHWAAGEAWFWDTLVDADLASNTANWQWVAGTGADAAPYFRIFNPMLQGEKFDADGAYTRRWVPEIADLPDKHIHTPWGADPKTLDAAGVKLGETYPKPIVDHKAARQGALDAFHDLKDG